MEFDVRPGGFQRWTEVSVAQPDLHVHIHIDLTDVTDGDLLEGVMQVTGRLQDHIEPFETRLRVEFHDEPDGRTDLRSGNGSLGTWPGLVTEGARGDREAGRYLAPHPGLPNRS